MAILCVGPREVRHRGWEPRVAESAQRLRRAPAVSGAGECWKTASPRITSMTDGAFLGLLATILTFHI